VKRRRRSETADTTGQLTSKKLDKSFVREEQPQGVPVKRGELFGEFNLGSTIVLIFEAPANFEFGVKQNDKVFFGQALGSVTSNSSNTAHKSASVSAF